MTGRPYAPPELAPESNVERLATEWVAPYAQAGHLRRARDWVVALVPEATPEMRLAALTHDIERMFPGGPVHDHRSTDWDDPFYLHPHMLRSAEAVTVWLGGHPGAAEEVDIAEVRRLIGLHEVGGVNGADAVQAADSLSYLETLAGLTASWVISGSCSREKGVAKLEYMASRVRLPAAREHIAPWLAWAVGQLPHVGQESG